MIQRKQGHLAPIFLFICNSSLSPHTPAEAIRMPVEASHSVFAGMIASHPDLRSYDLPEWHSVDVCGGFRVWMDRSF
jgi:hypothetical protein